MGQEKGCETVTEQQDAGVSKFAPKQSSVSRLLLFSPPTFPKNKRTATDGSILGDELMVPSTPAAQILFANTGSENIKVYLRIRPLNETEKRESGILTVRKLTDKSIGLTESKEMRQRDKYFFDHVFDMDAGQEDIFEETTLPLLRGLLQGFNGLVFAYGITNAGKTYTIQGTEHDDGILPRMLDKLFEILEQNESAASTRGSVASGAEEERASSQTTSRSSGRAIQNTVVAVTYLEIYNEKILDLLEDAPNGPMKQKRMPMQMHEQANGRVVIPGLREVEICSAKEGKFVLKKGQTNRKIASSANHDSSRSHSVFTVRLLRRSNASANDLIEVGHLSVVDLAGSERAKRTDNMGDRLKEASNINQSLTVLGRCLEILRWNQRHPNQPQKVIPFRESKVTRLFQDALSCKGRTVMIVNVSPAVDDLEETLHALRYSAIAKEIETQARVTTWRNATDRNTLIGDSSLHLDQSSSNPAEDELQVMPYEELLSTCESLRQQLVEAETRCLSVESDVRAEVAAEMEERMHELESMFQERVRAENKIAQKKLERKLALTHGGSTTGIPSTFLVSHEPSERLEQDTVQHHTAHAQLKEEFDALGNKYSALQTEHCNALKQVGQLQHESDTAKSQVKQLEQGISELRAFINKMQADFTKERDEIRANAEREVALRAQSLFEQRLAEHQEEMAAETERRIKEQVKTEFEHTHQALIKENKALSNRVKELIALQSAEKVKDAENSKQRHILRDVFQSPLKLFMGSSKQSKQGQQSVSAPDGGDSAPHASTAQSASDTSSNSKKRKSSEMANSAIGGDSFEAIEASMYGEVEENTADEQQPSSKRFRQSSDKAIPTAVANDEIVLVMCEEKKTSTSPLPLLNNPPEDVNASEDSPKKKHGRTKKPAPVAAAAVAAKSMQSPIARRLRSRK